MSDLEARTAATLKTLEQWCRDNGIALTPTGEVDEPTACRMLGFTSRDALRHQAAEGRLSRTLRRRRCGPRWLYELESIAREREEQYDRYSIT